MKLPFRTILIIPFLLAAFLCAHASPACAAPSLEDGMRRAAELLAAERYGDACDAYLDLMREYPEYPEVDLGLARAAVKAGRDTHAYLAYERLVSAFPDNAALRLEFASLLTRMGHVESARVEMEAARRLNPDLISEGDIAAVVKSMEAHGATFLAHGRLAGGMMYDSNMNSSPALRGVHLGSQDFVLDSDSTAKRTLGFYLQGAVDMAWRADEDASWWLVADISGYQRWNTRPGYRRDLTFGRGALGTRYLGDDLMVEIRAKAETVLENEEASLNMFGGESTLVYALTPETHLTFRGGAEYRNDFGNSGRDGVYLWGGPYIRCFFGEDHHSVMLGLKAYSGDTDTRRFSHIGLEPNLSVFLNLPWNNELVGSLSWRIEDYRGPATVFDTVDRRDTQWRASLFSIHKFGEHWRLELGWQYTNNRSNSDLYDYEQHIVMAGMAWVF